MPSPDLSGYTSLTLYDKTPAELVERALLDAAVKLPGWVPRDGNTEVVLTEALSLVVAELLYGINRVPDAVIEGVLKLYGVARDLGTAPTATVTFTASGTTGYTVPAGTVVRLPIGADHLDFTLDAPVAIAPGSLTGTGAVTATSNTVAANGVASGTAVTMISPVPFIDTAALASAVTAGADPETDEQWRDRGVQRLARLVSTLVTPAHFSGYALENPLVYRALGLDNYDGSGANTSTDYGHVTVAVLGAAGAVLTSGQKTALAAEMDALAQANLAVHVIDATVTAVAVTATVKARVGYDSATVTANVTAALNTFLNPDTWTWGATVRHNDLIAVIDGAEGVDYVVSLGTPAGDATLAGEAPLADLGTLTLTVT